MKKKRVLAVMLLLICLSMTQMATKDHLKASVGSDVQFYIQPHIIPGTTGPLIVTVYIDIPDAWDSTASGVVGWSLSVRVDPRILEVYGARKVPPTQASLTGPPPPYPGGFLENYLVRHGHNYYDDLLWMWVVDYPTDFYVGTLDPATGTMLDISEIIRGYGTLGVGAGGGPHPLCELLLMDRDGDAATDASVIDLFGPIKPPTIIWADPMYLTVDGTWHVAHVVEDGAYIAETPDAMYFDTDGYVSGDPLGTDWNELWPQMHNWWTLDGWVDGGSGTLTPSDLINLTQMDGPEPGKTVWGHAEWVNWSPIAGDGQADLIIDVLGSGPPDPIDTIPPLIGGISRIPNLPNYDEDVVVSATITDNVEVDHAFLSYTNDLAWHNVSMNRFDDAFNATIPAQPYGTLVQHKISANDTNGNWAESDTYSYTVGDFVAPEVSLSRFPAHPMSTHTVKVQASVTEPAEASGVDTVFFHYRANSVAWWNTTMVFNEELGLYESSIPEQPAGDMVEYYVEATDNAGNVNITATYSYVVLLAGDIDGDGYVGSHDAGVLNGAYGTWEGAPLYVPEADLDLDGYVGSADAGVLNANYGKTAV